MGRVMRETKPVKEKYLNKWCPHFKGYEDSPVKDKDLRCEDCVRHNEDCPYEGWEVKK